MQRPENAEEAEWQEAEAARAEYEAKAQQREAKHTPGPWRAAVELTSSRKIASVMKGTDMVGSHNVFTNISSNQAIRGQEPVANAALMAAAPDLLKAAQEALRYLQGEDLDRATLTKYDLIPLLEEAIKKATNTQNL